MSTALILVDHGSKREAANAMLEDVAAMYREVAPDALVEIAHMELAPPTLADAFARCIEKGARRIVVHPYFLAPGRHSREDIPRMAAEAAATHGGIDYIVTEPLGVDPLIGTVIKRRVEEALEKERDRV